MTHLYQLLICSFNSSDTFLAKANSFSFLHADYLTYANLISDELDHPESERVTERLENIDGEIDNIDITFVKMADPRYARKWGVTKLPSIVFFRKRFPSIYRGGCGKKEIASERMKIYRGFIEMYFVLLR